MTSMTGKPFVILMITLASVVDAGSFRKADASLRHDSSHLDAHISEEDVQSSLLSEVEGTFGEGAASSRLKQLELVLAPMYAALPKNEQGYLGHATVRYALHRLFIQRHGWSIQGLDTAGGHRNSTSGAGLLKDQVPSYIQDLFEKRLSGRGFGLHELGVLAATIEHLVHSETIKRLGDAYKVHNYLPTSLISVSEADDLLDTYMTAYILSEDLSKQTHQSALELKAEMPELYNHWRETQEFVRSMRQNVTKSSGSAEQEASGTLGFSIVGRVAERVGEDFGRFQDGECQQIKSSLVNMEERGTGRVRLSDFYKPAATDGAWQFSESVSYLRQLGALDETDPSKLRVIIANYMQSQSNCIASSSFYSVCCKDECEGLLGHLEEKIAAPEATPGRIAGIVAELSSSSVVAPRQLSQKMITRLEEISAGHGGSVQLHGRLFAQWMHHAFPRECPFPHLSGTTNPVTPDEWLGGQHAEGQDSTASMEEMMEHVNTDEHTMVQMKSTELPWSAEELQELPWSPEEELLVVRPPPVAASGKSTFGASLRNGLLFSSMVAIAYGLVHQSKQSADKKAGNWQLPRNEKYFV